jgi:L-arabinose isomerase
MTRRIGVIHPYWDFWQAAVEGDFARDRRDLAVVADITLATDADIVWSVTVQPGDDIKALRSELDQDIDAIVVVSTMAASPGAVLALLAEYPRTPVVIWAAHLGLGTDENLSHSGITLRGGTVGAPMIGADLTRQGRPFDVVAGEITDTSHIGDAVRRATAAGAVRRSRLAVVGTPLPGYEWARIANERLEQMGIEVVASKAEDLATRINAVSASAISHGRSHLDGFDIEDDVDDEALDTAVRYSVALDEFVSDGRISAGTLNCHVPQLRLDPALGSAPCFALGRSTSRGVPWTCTGDVATSLAMLLVASLGAPTLYHEIEALDELTGEAILANSGEHDSRFVASTDQRIIINPWFPREPATVSAEFSIAPGPASLVGVASDHTGALTVVVATGSFTDRTSPASGTVNAGFEFASGSITEAWERWAVAGVGHHSCATDRQVARDLEVVCRHLGLGFVEV